MPAIDVSKFQKKKAAPATGYESPFSFLQKDISFGKKELPDKKKEQLYLELSSLLQAGVNLKSSLELITTDQSKAQDKLLFEKIQRLVVAGAGFSAALRETGKFSLYEIFSIQIGEETGQLNQVLQELALYYQNKIRQRRKIVSALTYPCVVLCTSLGAVYFMLKVIVPMFGDIFKKFGGHLPWITEKIISVSNALGHVVPIILFFAILATILTISSRNNEVFRKAITNLVLRLPVVGNLVQKIYLARFCSSMRLLISAKIPLLRAIALIRQMIRFYPLETSLKAVETDITAGKSLHQSLQRFSIYPPKMIQLVKVGEETNQLDHFFEKIAAQYIDEVEFKTAALSSVMEPLIIVFLGLIVGVILISMYLPLFQMSNSFQ